MHVIGNGIVVLAFASLLGLSGSGCAAPRAGEMHVGPLYQSLPDFEGNAGFQFAGPLVERRVSPEGKRFTAIRPFWSHAADADAHRAGTDILWPLGVFTSRGNELHWRMLPAFGHVFDTDASSSRHRWALFPILFGGRDAEKQAYFAVFPVGGRLHAFLGYDRVWFVLFPVYARSYQGENRTTSVLWPIYSRTTGGDNERWRVWPLYGYSYNPDRWTKRFVLWPIWTSVDYHYPDMEGGAGFILFPLYGQVRLPRQQSRMLFPPLFKVEWGETDHFAFNAPWPILQYVDSPNQQRFYLFPFGGRLRRRHDHSWFVLWPFVSGRRSERPREVLTRFQVLPFWYYEDVRKRLPDEPGSEGVSASEHKVPVSRYVRVWPVWMYRREEEQSLVRVPDLWPLRQTPGIDRNWAPLWTLYRRERANERRLSVWLWGMARWEKSPEEHDLRIFPLLESQEQDKTRRWRFLYGFLGYERDNLQKKYQLLYFLRIRRMFDGDEITSGDAYRGGR